MCVVPAKICNPGSSKTFDACAVLENMLVEKKIAEALDVTETDTRLTVKTINGNISQTTTVIANLRVAESIASRKSK